MATTFNKKKYTSEEIEKRTKAKVIFPTDIQLTMLAGATIMHDESKPYAIITGQEPYLKQLRDLHPDWEVSDPFVDMED